MIFDEWGLEPRISRIIRIFSSIILDSVIFRSSIQLVESDPCYL